MATCISFVDTIRKFILRAPLAACPWPSRPSTEPGHRAGHALQRTCRPRAQSARTTRCSMAAAPSPLPRRTKRCQQMLPGTALRMPCTDLHRGNTHHMSVSVADVQTNKEKCSNGTQTMPRWKARARAPRASGAARLSCADVASAAVGSVAMMPELSPVLVERWHGPWSDCRHAAGADERRASRTRFRFPAVLCAKEMEVGRRAFVRFPDGNRKI